MNIDNKFLEKQSNHANKTYSQGNCSNKQELLRHVSKTVQGDQNFGEIYFNDFDGMYNKIV